MKDYIQMKIGLKRHEYLFKKMQVAIYARVSRDDMNPENQLIELERYAKAFEYNYEIFQEKESTRKTRPIQWDLFNRLRRKEFDCLLVWKLDRWARTHAEFILHMDEFRSRDIKFISLRDGIDTTKETPYTKMFMGIMSIFAEFERDLISERTKAGLARVRAKGKKLGRPTKSNRTYAKPSRKEVSELMSKGKTVREIAKELKTSRYWAHTVIKEVKALSERGDVIT